MNLFIIRRLKCDIKRRPAVLNASTVWTLLDSHQENPGRFGFSVQGELLSFLEEPWKVYLLKKTLTVFFTIREHLSYLRWILGVDLRLRRSKKPVKMDKLPSTSSSGLLVSCK